MERKEPYATPEEFDQHVIRYRDVPPIELGPDAKSHIVSAERIMLSCITAEPNAVTPKHHHESEQIVIILGGAMDMILDGKLYPVKEGDVIIIPSNVEHGSYNSDKTLRVIDVFSPPRQDFLAKLEEVKKS